MAFYRYYISGTGAVFDVDFDRISFLEVSEQEENFEVKISFRKKATLKEHSFNPPNKKDFLNIMARHNIKRLENYFINISRISFVKSVLKGAKVELTFYFKDGQYLELTTNVARFEGWRNINLI